MKRIATVMVAGILLFVTAGCYSGRLTPLAGPGAASDSVLVYHKGLDIEGYVDNFGAYHRFSGHVRALAGDSLAFDGGSTAFSSLQSSASPIHLVLPRSRVLSVDARRLSPGKTLVAAIVAPVLVGTVILGLALALKESCPFIYSYDGRGYVFDGEPYGGATMKGLERTDWSALEHLVAVKGEYRLQLTNEVDETQHTNRLTLLVVDHSPGSTVVMDKFGRPHAFRSLEPLSAARDERERDLMNWLRDTDRSAWYPDLEQDARGDSLADTRDHITLTFRRPPRRDHVYLVANAATGLWGSHMIRTLLGLRGDHVADFYAAINSNAIYRQQLADWNLREELFELVPEVQVGERWIRQDFIPGGGPFISETRAIPLDLGGVAGDEVKIRIHPPIGFWSLNSFHLAWEQDSARVTRVAPKRAVDQTGAEVTAALLADDDAYLDFPTQQDRAQIVYDAPPPARGFARTIFAETRGWYEVHLHAPSAPDTAALMRLTSENGYAVRRSLQEYREFRRSGRIAGVPSDTASAHRR